MDAPFPYLFAAVHMGPYLTIQSLELELGPERVCYLVEGASREERARKGLPYLDVGQIEQPWESLPKFLQQREVKAVIRSTSDDVVERDVERLASMAAAEAGVPVFVIEDFPGNYWPKVPEPLDGLFVEDDSLIELHRSRGVDPALVHNTGNPRYTQLAKYDRDELRLKARADLGLDGHKVVLWAGQPNGDDSYQALVRLIKHFPDRRFTLLFRAHPRDKAYLDGKYTELLAKAPVNILDVTASNDAMSLYCASDLLVTQFSSAGVEASFMGVPALYVLFDDLGKRCFATHEGSGLTSFSSSGSSSCSARVGARGRPTPFPSPCLPGRPSRRPGVSSCGPRWPHTSGRRPGRAWNGDRS